MESHLLQDLAIVMAAAGAMTLICHRLKQPVVIGYLLAGLLIGPFTPPFSLVSNLKSIHLMAELGLVFLMFSLGLEFNLPKIKRVGVSAGLAAVLEVTSMLLIGYALGRAFGWARMDSIFLGAVLSISSTTIIVKVFMDFKMMQEKFVQVVFGILILEDIVAIAILSILSGLGSTGGPDAAAVVVSFVRIALFVVLFLVIGLLIVPRLMRWVGAFKSKEVLGIVTLGLCLGGSLLALHFELSVALGAFLIGAVLAASSEIRDIEEWIHPVRDMFSAIFFVSAGMLIQPQLLVQYWLPIVIVTAVTIVGKVASGAVGSFLVGYDVKTSARVGMSVAQIGEFSFVIASLGVSLDVTSDFLYPLAVTVSSLTTLATPYLIKSSDRVVEGALASLPKGVRWRLDIYHHAIVRRGKSVRTGHATAIFSRYLVRLAVYVAAISAIGLLLRQVSWRMNGEQTPGAIVALWSASAVACLPIFQALSKYACHIVLLLVTRSKFLLRHLDIHGFYASLNAMAIAALAGSFVAGANRFSGDLSLLGGAATVTAAGLFALYKPAKLATEFLESLLDDVTGLATSEPTRQAILTSGENALLLVDITDQVALTSDAPAAGKTIRQLNLRQRTGASIVAIYRDGRHIASPDPDLRLAVDDIVVLLGEERELSAARGFLLPPEPNLRKDLPFDPS